MKKAAFILLLLCPVFLAVNAQDQEIQEQDIYVENNLSEFDRTYETFAWMQQAEHEGQMKTEEDLKNEERTDRQRQGDEGFTEDAQGQTMDRHKSEKDKVYKDKAHKKAHKEGEAKMGKAMSGDFTIEQAITYEMVSRGYDIDEQNPDLLVGYQVFSEETELEGFDRDDTGTTAPLENETVQAESGSLLVTFSDPESGTMIWKGLVSGAFSDTASPQDNKTIIRAVASVFDRFAIDEAAQLGAGTR